MLFYRGSTTHFGPAAFHLPGGQLSTRSYGGCLRARFLHAAINVRQYIVRYYRTCHYVQTPVSVAEQGAQAVTGGDGQTARMEAEPWEAPQQILGQGSTGPQCGLGAVGTTVWSPLRGVSC